MSCYSKLCLQVVTLAIACLPWAIGCSHTQVTQHDSACHSFYEKNVDSENWDQLMQEGSECLSQYDFQVLSNAHLILLLHLGEGMKVRELIGEEREAEKDAASIKLPSIQPAVQSDGPLQASQVPTYAEKVQKAVVYVYGANEQGQVDENLPLATAFIASIPSRSDPTRTIFLLLTSRHVFDPAWANCPPNPSRVYLRMNKLQSGEVGYEPVDLIVQGQKRYEVADNQNIDAAAIFLMPGSLPLNKYDIAYIPISVFATDSEIQGLKPQTLIGTAGLIPFVQAGNHSTNKPVFQQGFIAVKTNQEVSAHCSVNLARQINVWLISPPLENGYSGAPIFTMVTRKLEGKSQKGLVLIGLQSMKLNSNAQAGGMTPVASIMEVVQKITKPFPEADISRGFAK